MRSNLGGILCLFVCLYGCGRAAVPKLVPVEGTLTFQSRPLANKSLKFIPESGSGLVGQGSTDERGKYRLLAIVPGAVSDYAGLPPGKYKVLVFEPMVVMQTPGASGPSEMLIPNANVSEIPSLYQAENTTRLFVEVLEAGGTIDLEIPVVP